jgi:hypothetical protein
LRVRVFLLQFLVRLVSSYRYAGEHVDDELARAEAAELHTAVVTKKEALHGDVIRIISSRSKPQLKATFERYKQDNGKTIDEVPFLSPSTAHTVKIFSLNFDLSHEDCTVSTMILISLTDFCVPLIRRFLKGIATTSSQHC